MLRLLQQRSLEASRTCARNSRFLHATASQQVLAKFTMPAMSPTMTEGGIASWKRKEGESFAPGDVLVEIETDKATMDVEAQDDGILAKIMISDGSKSIPVGAVIAIVAEEGDDLSPAAIEALLAESSDDAPAPQAAAEVVEQAPAKVEEASKVEEAKAAPAAAPTPAAPAVERSVILASPLAKRMALDQGIPLSQVVGTGPGGRITKVDIESYKPTAAVAPTPAPAPATRAAPVASTSSTPAAPTALPSSSSAYTDTPVSSMRKIIASRLSESKSTIPHYYLTTEINMDRVNKLRSVFNGAAKSAESVNGGVKDGVKSGIKLSVNDFIVKACASALQDVPEVNSGWHGDFVRRYHNQDISIAVATPTGLITPIIANAGSLGLASISSLTKTLAAKARDGKLKPAEYQGGSFTISNLGMMGIESFTAIINPPQSCILAIGATEKKLIIDEESEKGFKEVSVMKVTMSCDHRVVDGAVGAQWMKAFKAYLESPLSLML